MKLPFSLSVAVLICGTSFGWAADMPLRASRTAVEARESGPDRVAVTIDELYLHRNCNRDPDCIAPRVLPILADSRRATYVEVTIPIDRRFADRYEPR